MHNLGDLDTILVAAGNRVFNGGPVKKRIGRGITGIRLIQPAGGSGSATRAPMDPAAVRRTLGAIVRRTPQVMVRISGGGKSVRHIKAHLDYISRNGRIALEDQNGDPLAGKDDVDALRDEWRDGGFPILDDGRRKEAFNLVLSMPAGTSDRAVLRAARDFAASEFANFQYVMALHTPDTDPDKEPSPHPHVHLCVKSTGLDGARLNPRKHDLQRWREQFAERLREHGVACEATGRLHRLQPVRGEKQSVRQKKARGEPFARIGKGPPNHARIARAREAELQLLTGYRELAQGLARSPDPDDRQLAIGLVRRVADRKPRQPEVERAVAEKKPREERGER